MGHSAKVTEALRKGRDKIKGNRQGVVKRPSPCKSGAIAPSLKGQGWSGHRTSSDVRELERG